MVSVPSPIFRWRIAAAAAADRLDDFKFIKMYALTVIAAQGNETQFIQSSFLRADVISTRLSHAQTFND